MWVGGLLVHAERGLVNRRGCERTAMWTRIWTVAFVF